jgi:DNA-directed RNA polymerase
MGSHREYYILQCFLLKVILIKCVFNHKGKLWWTSSDNPWQTLAACMEIAEALKSPNPENFISGFPIHQDGSCNGLQHYAALGRDEIGAFSVNLHPSDVPQDVYSSVASAVILHSFHSSKNLYTIN